MPFIIHNVLAGKLNISVYDASYMLFARKKSAILVPADNKLIKKLSGVISMIGPAELLKQS